LLVFENPEFQTFLAGVRKQESLFMWLWTEAEVTVLGLYSEHKSSNWVKQSKYIYFIFLCNKWGGPCEVQICHTLNVDTIAKQSRIQTVSLNKARKLR
jgi:hypothetical protein